MYSFFFYKQKTAYEMRISDWSSDVCSSDLMPETVDLQKLADIQAIRRIKGLYCDTIDRIIRDKRPDDTEKLRALFTENAVIDFTLLDGKVYSGSDMIIELFTGVMPATTSWMWHTIGAEELGRASCMERVWQEG